MLHLETAEQVMLLDEWANGVVTCAKVCKELQRMLLPQLPGARLCAARALAAGKILHGKVGLGAWKHCHWWDPHPTPREPLGGVWTLAYIKEQDPWKKAQSRNTHRKWALFGPGREQGNPTWRTLERWLHVMLPSTNKSPGDQISKSKVQRL